MSLIMGDYVAGFLGLAEGNAWSLNAFDVRNAISPMLCNRHALPVDLMI